MKKINFKILIITCVLCLLPIVFGLVFYDSLPDRIAIHFDVNNNPDNFGSKDFFVFGMPTIMMLVQIICCVIVDLKDENPEANKKTLSVMKLLIPVLTAVLYVVTLMYAMDIGLDIRKVVMLILGVMFIVIGNYLPKMIGNPTYLSIRFTIEKIKNEKLNNKIKRIAGYLFIIDGVLFIISIFFKPIVSVGILILLVVQSFWLFVYAAIKNEK